MKAGTRTTERVQQKERTRQKLLSAARALVENGEALTIARAAERADVAEATAYRYYREPRSLLRDALSIDWSGLGDLIEALGSLPAAADRAQMAAEEMARFVLAREAGVRLLFASTEQTARDRATSTGLPAASYRRRLIEAVLKDSGETFGPDLRRVELALTVVISPHSVLTLRDALQMQPEQVSMELGLMAKRLVLGFDRRS